MTSLFTFTGSRTGINTAFIAALQRNDFAQAQMLLDKGAGINFSNQNGDNPLENAIKSRNIPAIRWLIAHEAYLGANSAGARNSSNPYAINDCPKLPEATLTRKNLKL